MMPTKQNAPHHPKAMESAATKPHFANTTQQVNILKAIQPVERAPNFGLALACTTGASYGKISTKAKALGLKNPVLQNTFDTAVCTPTDKRGFFTSKFFRHGCFAHIGMVLGGMGLRYPKGRAQSARTPAWLYPCFEHPAHPLRFKTQKVAIESHTGAPTMQVNPMGHHAPTSKATPAIPSTTEAHALLEATTASTLATWYIKHDNIAQARRKLRQALQALHTLEVSSHA